VAPSGFDRSKIIADLYESKEVNQAISKMEPAHLRNELKQECFMVLLELPEERLEALWYGGNLRPFLCGVIRRKAISPKDSFYKLFRRPVIEYQEEKEVAETEYQPDEKKEAKIEKMAAAMATLHFYDRGILELYADMSCPQISIKTGIPRQSIYDTVRRTKLRIIAQVKP
jgi:DNA-directed RNA polymerase specialized sigma24 family protein